MTIFSNVSNLYSANTNLKSAVSQKTDAFSNAQSSTGGAKLTSNLDSLAQGGRYLVSHSNTPTFKGVKVSITPEQSMKIAENFLKLTKSATTSCEEMTAKIKKLDILNDEKGLETVLSELANDYEKLLNVKTPKEHRAVITYLGEKYKALDEEMIVLMSAGDEATVAKASEVFEKAYMPKIMRTQEIMAIVDNRPEIKGAYG